MENGTLLKTWVMASIHPRMICTLYWLQMAQPAFTHPLNRAVWVIKIFMKCALLFLKKKSPQLTLLKGIVTDEMSGTFVEAIIEIVDNEKNKIVNTITSNK